MYIQERVEILEKEFKKLDGLRGEKGDTVVGQQGVPGRDGTDANVSECVAVAKIAFEQEIAALHAKLGSAVVHALKSAGVIDSNGNAILVAGPAGENSVIPGPKGDSITGARGEKGDSITGEPGRDGVDGKTPDISELVSVAKSEVNQFVETKLSEFQNGLRDLIVQLLKERNVLDAEGNAVPGPGGPSGKDGKDAFVSPADIAHLEIKFRNQWKSDIQIALRAHFSESHKG